MSHREEIAELAGIYIETLNRGHGVITRFEQGNRAAEAILASGYRKPRTITTAEELDDLPVGTVVLDSERDVCERMSFGWCAIVKEDGSHPWLLDGAEDVELPATVLHEGNQP